MTTPTDPETAYYADGSVVTGPSPLPDRSPSGAIRVSGSGAKLVARPGEVDRGPSAAERWSRPVWQPFDHHEPTVGQHERIAPVRAALAQVYEAMGKHVPSSPDRTLAFRHLQEALFFATTAIESEGERYLS